MHRIAWWLTALVATVIAALAVTNWSVLVQPTSVNLLVTQVDAPLGLMMLALAGVLLGLFGLAVIGGHVASLLETRRLLKEVHRLQALADQAEASRVEGLQRLISNEFRQLNERLNRLNVPAAPELEDLSKLPLVKLP